jgi:hypothetical protein
MGLFSKFLKGNDKPESGQPYEKNEIIQKAQDEINQQESISFMLLYKSIPKFNEESLRKRISNTLGDSLNIDMFFCDEKAMMLGGNYQGNKIMVAGLYFTYPQQVLDQILPICHFSADDKNKFKHSKAHVLFSINTGNTPPHVLFDTLIQLVNCFVAEDGNAIGLVIESAMTATILSSVPKISEERQKLLTEKSMPFWSWFSFTGGFVKYIIDPNTIWYVTKGNHQFGLPELAYKGGATEGNDTLMTFKALFSYMYGYGAKLAAGQTAEIGEANLRFSELTEYADLFEGKYGTLVVNKV